jgi:hypothetical protein
MTEQYSDADECAAAWAAAARAAGVDPAEYDQRADIDAAMSAHRGRVRAESPYWRVRYRHLRGYMVSRSFPTQAAAQEFIDVNAMVHPLPDRELINPAGEVIAPRDPAEVVAKVARHM